jgi:hypothetical protein
MIVGESGKTAGGKRPRKRNEGIMRQFLPVWTKGCAGAIQSVGQGWFALHFLACFIVKPAPVLR